MGQRALRAGWLAVVLLIAPLAAAAADLDLTDLRRRSQACLDGGDRIRCSAALQESHRLKTAAEARRLLRCYTALLGVEALLIADRLRSDTPSTRLASGFEQASQECAARGGAPPAPRP